jgi:TPR repeat protein
MKTMLAVALLCATAAPAVAGDFDCGQPQVLTGEVGRNPVVSIAVHHNRKSGTWSIVHRLADGTIVARENQYNITDRTDPNAPDRAAWGGYGIRNPNLYMIGQIFLASHGSWQYQENLLDRAQQNIMVATAICKYVGAPNEADLPAPDAMPMPGVIPTPEHGGGFEDAEAAFNRKDYATAFRLLVPLAEHGDAKAQTFLGGLYKDGEGAPQDYAEALKWYRKAAEQGEAFGQMGLGDMYWGGLGVPQDYAEALAWYRKAAEQGNAFLQYNLGHIHEQGRDKQGRGVPEDYVEAVKWFRKAAEQGDAASQGELGRMYEVGHGVPEDYVEAVKWFRKAAEQGAAASQLDLGRMYWMGRGVPQDYVLAYMWFNLAGTQLRVDGQREMLAEKMTPEQIAEAQRLAREWKPTK